MHQTELAPTPSFEDFPFSAFDSIKATSTIDLPARIQALNRRAAIVSTSLAHLTAVVKPLESTKPEEVSDGQLGDMHYEGQVLGEAMEEFKEQMDEVKGMLQELLVSRKKARWEKMGGRGDCGWNVGRRPPLGF